MVIESSAQHQHDTRHILDNPLWYGTLTLNERLALLRTQGDKTTFDGDLARQRLQAWRAQRPFDEDIPFYERLALDGLSEDEFTTLLGAFSEITPPPWLHELAQALTEPVSEEMERLFSLPEDGGKPITRARARYARSFLVALLPLINRGVERFKSEIQALLVDYPTPPFHPASVHRVFLVSLFDQVLQQVSRTLTLELHIARLEGRLAGETPAERFQSFVRQLGRKEQLSSFLEEYAPLARIIQQTMEQWLSFSVEILRHLCADWGELRQNFSPEDDPGRLMKIRGGAGDAHKGGRSTVKLRFASGLWLVYKPRSLAIDLHFQQLLAWLNEQGDHPGFRTLRILDKGDYGWSEFVEAQDCTSEEGVARFYERQGGYLALLYLLNATDVHHENLIAGGEHPVMVDLEALFHPIMATPGATPVLRTAYEAIQGSVLRIGLLPERSWGTREKPGVDISGLGGMEGQFIPTPVLQMDGDGTDHMRFVRQHIQVDEQSNLPTMEGQSVGISAYKERFIQGFSKMYRLLMAHRTTLLADLLPLFAHDEIRLIVCSTQTYYQVLLESYHPDLLRDTLDRDLFFDHLWRRVKGQPYLKRMIQAERADLHQGDIPFFSTRPETRDVYTSRGECLPDLLDEPSMEAARRRARHLSEEDLTRQLWFIQASFAAVAPGGQHPRQYAAHSGSQKMRATPEQLVQAACIVGDRLVERVLLDQNGAHWLGLTFINEREWMVLPAGLDLYDGVAGITLFLAYLGNVTQEQAYTQLARHALAATREQVKARMGNLLAVGAFDGWGGIIYLYTHLGVLWQDADLLKEAHDLVQILPELIEQDQDLDIIGGAAGCIACLLGLYSVSPSATLLEMALRCGEHILKHSPYGSVEQPAEKPLTGFSHGSAGIAYSLLWLAQVSGEQRFREHALAAIEYERSVFSSKRQNWPDYRPPLPGDDPTIEEYMLTWCHGAPGIGLGRLASLPYLDDANIRQEIAIALQTTHKSGFGLGHSLCHGDLGNIELLFSAAQLLQDPTYQAIVEEHLALILSSIEADGWHTGIPAGMETPGLMTGIAGIGYNLLRLAAPQQVPCLLTLAEPIK